MDEGFTIRGCCDITNLAKIPSMSCFGVIVKVLSSLFSDTSKDVS